MCSKLWHQLDGYVGHTFDDLEFNNSSGLKVLILMFSQHLQQIAFKIKLDTHPKSNDILLQQKCVTFGGQISNNLAKQRNQSGQIIEDKLVKFWN